MCSFRQTSFLLSCRYVLRFQMQDNGSESQHVSGAELGREKTVCRGGMSNTCNAFWRALWDSRKPDWYCKRSESNMETKPTGESSTQKAAYFHTFWSDTTLHNFVFRTIAQYSISTVFVLALWQAAGWNNSCSVTRLHPYRTTSVRQERTKTSGTISQGSSNISPRR